MINQGNIKVSFDGTLLIVTIFGELIPNLQQILGLVCLASSCHSLLSFALYLLTRFQINHTLIKLGGVLQEHPH